MSLSPELVDGLSSVSKKNFQEALLLNNSVSPSLKESFFCTSLAISSLPSISHLDSSDKPLESQILQINQIDS